MVHAAPVDHVDHADHAIHVRPVQIHAAVPVGLVQWHHLAVVVIVHQTAASRIVVTVVYLFHYLTFVTIVHALH